jgi:putative phosphoesterase
VGKTSVDLGRIGVISDTHGLLRPEAVAALQGVDAILHAGDIGGMEIIRALERLAPVTFVLGNNDDADGYGIARTTIAGVRVLLTHILPRPHALARGVAASLRAEPADIVVFGHSHLPHNEVIGGVRFFNPASAGPRRFDYPVSVGILDGDGARHVALDTRSAAALKKRMNQLSGG